MGNIKYFVYVFIIIAFSFMAGCVSSDTRGTKGETGMIDDVPTTLAILPFENNSVTDPEYYNPLSKGLAAMLITDLKNSGTTVRIIEREKILTLLEEVELSQSGSVDKSTAIKVGKILGAQTIAFGSFMVIDPNVRMDLRIIKVETSETIMAESINGSSRRFIALEQRLAKKIAGSLKLIFQPAAKKGSGTIDAALLFSRGLEALDAGNRPKARELFKKSIEQDPSYKVQVANVKGLAP